MLKGFNVDFAAAKGLVHARHILVVASLQPRAPALHALHASAYALADTAWRTPLPIRPHHLLMTLIMKMRMGWKKKALGNPLMRFWESN